MTLTPTYALLGLAIMLEVAGTSLLAASQQFTRPLPTAGMALCYGLAFYLLSITVKVLPVGIVYAVWSGMGIVLIAALGWAVFRQPLDSWALLGLGLIIAGVVILNTLSGAVRH